MGKIWALADLHLAIGVPEKKMDVFGEGWIDYTNKIERNWRNLVGQDDLVLLPGDISWAMRLEDAVADLKWIDALPGTKVMIRGNHDYWWSSISKVRKILPPSIHAIQNDSFLWGDVVVAGTRLWDSDEYGFGPFIEYVPNPISKPAAVVTEEQKREEERIFLRELERLEMSLKTMSPKAKLRIAMVHYPPIGADLVQSRTSDILERYGVDFCLFGHLHRVRGGALPFGEARGVLYRLTSADYLDFTPLLIMDQAITR
jgi:predicted phosphohydrolase